MWPKWQFCRPPEAWLRQCVAPLGVPLGPNVVKETFLWRQNHLKTGRKKDIRKKLSPKYCARSHDHGISSRPCYHHTNAVSLNGFLDRFFFVSFVTFRCRGVFPWFFDQSMRNLMMNIFFACGVQQSDSFTHYIHFLLDFRDLDP